VTDTPPSTEKLHEHTPLLRRKNTSLHSSVHCEQLGACHIEYSEAIERLQTLHLFPSFRDGVFLELLQALCCFRVLVARIDKKKPRMWSRTLLIGVLQTKPILQRSGVILSGQVPALYQRQMALEV